MDSTSPYNLSIPFLNTNVFSASYRQLEMTYLDKVSESFSRDLTSLKEFRESIKKIPDEASSVSIHRNEHKALC